MDNLKVGDTVRRIIANLIPMDLTITKIDEKLIHCGDWTFDRVTGAEIDETLGWNSQFSGSYITLPPALDE